MLAAIAYVSNFFSTCYEFAHAQKTFLQEKKKNMGIYGHATNGCACCIWMAVVLHHTN